MWGILQREAGEPCEDLSGRRTRPAHACALLPRFPAHSLPSVLLSTYFLPIFFLVKFSIIFVFQFLKFKSSLLFPLHHWVLAKRLHVPGCTVGFRRSWEITRQPSNLKRRPLGLWCKGLRYRGSLPPFAFFNNCLSPSQEGSPFSLPPSYMWAQTHLPSFASNSMSHVPFSARAGHEVTLYKRGLTAHKYQSY